MKRGRPKGYKPYYEISYEELGQWVGKKAQVQVSKKWLDFLMGEGNDEESLPSYTETNPIQKKEELNKIEYTLSKI
tara:strand:- start:3862 stop:4089 length:228 start_codon:yes stop_codon:yes gene_type:complete